MTVKSFKSTSNVMFIEASAAITRRGVKFAWEWLQVEDIKNTTIQQNGKEFIPVRFYNKT